MSFASVTFIWLFLPVVLLTYWVFPARYRNYVVSIASLVFYAYGAHSFVGVLILLVVFNYAAGRVVATAHMASRARGGILGAAVAVNLGVLIYWKYGGFLDQQIVTLNHATGGHWTRTIATVLPLGISFFTFHNISYLVDVSRRRTPPIRHFIDFSTYVCMFPQLIAGPIVRYHEIAAQLTEVRTNRLDDLAAGFPRFVHGLFKKVVIADMVGPIADASFAQPHGGTTASAWLGVAAYTLQIYFDFSGYTDMAIGMGRMLGFRLPENFERPYSATSMTDFWHRWHMSLSRWFRDYLYIPLGGNRKGEWWTYANLLIVFTLCGFWHGAAWTFVAWGLYHGAHLVFERRRRGVVRDPRLDPLRRARTLLFVMVGWLLFRAASFTVAAHMAEAMITPSGWHLPAGVALSLTKERLAILLLAATMVTWPSTIFVGQRLEFGRGRAAGLMRLGAVSIGSLGATVFLLTETFHPFLYYQF